jgi:outer membrane lipopolysaccharide assembly protein LptE/RlpB
MTKLVARICAGCLLLAALAGCGYHTSGHADLLPKRIKTIAVPAFDNVTTHYRLTGLLAKAIAREFISRTRYNVVADPAEADAVLRGSVLQYSSYTTTLEPSGRASGIEMIVSFRITLTDRATGKVLFTRPTMEVRERYEVASDPRAYFEESDIALERMSRSVSRSVVSAVLENF